MEVGTAVTLVAGGLAGLLIAVLVRRRAGTRSYRYPEERSYPVPPQWWVYPVSVLLGAGLAWRHADRPATLAVLLVLWAPLLLLAVIDQDTHRLPDRLTKPLYPLLALALLVTAAVEGDWPGYVRALVGGLLAFLLYLLLAVVGRGALGWGDVKLAGILGMALGWVSWTAVLYGALAGLFLATGFALVLVLARRLTRKDFIPLGPFLIIGAVGTLVVAP